MTELEFSTARVMRRTCALLACATVLAGCSGSSDPDNGESEPASLPVASEPNGDRGIDAPPGALNDPGAPTPPGATVATGEGGASGNTEVDTDPVEGTDATPIAPVPEPASPAVPDPLTPNATRVDFAIVVPAYQSDALRVEVDFGGRTLVAGWDGDEFWSAAGMFPTDTEEALVVTFYDDNGDLELAQVNRRVRTGSNAAQSIRIAADEFDTGRFDADGDGISNLDEAIAGTDPTVDEDALLPVRDFYPLSRWSWLSVSADLEARVTDARPASISLDTVPADPEREGSTTGRVDIDAAGNGTVAYSYEYFACDNRSYAGTRTVSENAVSWDAEYTGFDCDYSKRVDVTNTVTVVDDTTRSFREQIVGRNVGTFDYRWETSLDLTGERVAGTSQCRMAAGTIAVAYRNVTYGDVDEITVSKAPGDRYWRVLTVSNESDTSEYFVRDIGYRFDQQTFTCEFVDL